MAGSFSKKQPYPGTWMKPGRKRHNAGPRGAMMRRFPLAEWGLCAALVLGGRTGAPAVEAGFQCAWAAAKPAQEILDAAPVTGSIHAVALFGRFSDQEARPGHAPPAFAEDLFDPNRPGSVTHFFTEMSRGQYEITGSVLPKEYSAAGPASSYISPVEGEPGRYSEYVAELLAASDSEIDYSQYDNDGPDGVPDSGDDDGIVDFLFVMARSTPPGFIIRNATGIATLGLATSSFRTDDRGADGGFIRIDKGVTQQGSNFSKAAGNMCHEFAHTLGLPDLYDTDVLMQQEEVPPSRQSAGIGNWGLMGQGALGWGGGGPNPLSAWSLAKLGWLGVANSRLRRLDSDAEGLVFEDVNAGGEVVLIQVNASRYLLVEHRSRANSYYERNLPAEGLLIWEVDENAFGNNEEALKKVDLVCADGLYLDAGYPAGTEKGYHIGRDNLDFWSGDEEYNTRFSGNSGDATDVFDGALFTDFSIVSNPAAPRRISISNIRREGEAMVAEVQLNDRRRAGLIAAEDVWVDTMELVGDLFVGPEATVRLLNGTTVLVTEDQRRAGGDSDRCEIVVLGDFVTVSGGGRSRIMPAGPRPAPGGWGGFSIRSSGSIFLRNCDIDFATVAIRSEGVQVDLHLDNVTISNTVADGVRVNSDNAVVNLEGLLVRNAGANGVVVTGPGARVRVEDSRIEGSRGSGLVRVGGRFVCLDSEFEGNGEETEDAANLVLGRRTQGIVRGNRFSGGTGVLAMGSAEVLIEQNQFEGNRVAVITESAGLSIVDNYFADTELVFQVSGLRLPERLELNAVEGAARLIDNRSELELLADNNWWGRDDETWIAERISGPVAWRPWLNFDPRVPIAFELKQNFPNPFNASTRIRYTVGIIHASLSHQSEMSLEVRNLTGGLVRRLARAPAAPGIYDAVWDGTDESGYRAGSGLYYCEFRVGALVLRRKMTLVR